jgi:hypothetical protein
MSLGAQSRLFMPSKNMLITFIAWQYQGNELLSRG